MEVRRVAVLVASLVSQPLVPTQATLRQLPVSKRVMDILFSTLVITQARTYQVTRLVSSRATTTIVVARLWGEVTSNVLTAAPTMPALLKATLFLLVPKETMGRLMDSRAKGSMGPESMDLVDPLWLLLATSTYRSRCKFMEGITRIFLREEQVDMARGSKSLSRTRNWPLPRVQLLISTPLPCFNTVMEAIMQKISRLTPTTCLSLLVALAVCQVAFQVSLRCLSPTETLVEPIIVPMSLPQRQPRLKLRELTVAIYTKNLEIHTRIQTIIWQVRWLLTRMQELELLSEVAVSRTRSLLRSVVMEVSSR